ncbi:hypothetical protein K2173_024928 [Erythroxylum novogranatense]|uniref:RNase H type-1 domain-containing protein n=1 Tax=Erythroxylum novogranatense TaxID=1862640 RepID=A0AAV8UCY3_9ROSI|nr:hypothetical protein K2173_024928 [Erythroxylum novogranatense]
MTVLGHWCLVWFFGNFGLGVTSVVFTPECPQSITLRRQLLEVYWQRPREGWVNLSTDGSSKGNPCLATAGGLIRDAGGCWLAGFGTNLGFCSPWQAELWVVYHGLTLAWFHGYSRVDLTIDSAMVVSNFTNASHQVVNNLVLAIWELLLRNWIVRARHVFRESNRCVDWLANYSYRLPVGVQWFNQAIEGMSTLLFADSIGVALPRVATHVVLFFGRLPCLFEQKKL